jgi:hypothetical protein
MTNIAIPWFFLFLRIRRRNGRFPVLILYRESCYLYDKL